jgi:nucleoside-diphosphate kinase
MATERTFSIIKPDATRRNLTGAVTKMLEDAACASSRPSAST